MLQNTRATIFIYSELLRVNQQVGKINHNTSCVKIFYQTATLKKNQLTMIQFCFFNFNETGKSCEII